MISRRRSTSGARANQHVQTAVAADVNPSAAFPSVAATSGSTALASSQAEQSYVAVASSGAHLLVAWVESDQVRFVASADGGQTFSAPAAASSSSNGQRAPSVAVTADHAYVAWQEVSADRKVIRLATSIAANATRTLTAYVASESGNERIRVASIDGATPKLVEADAAPTLAAPNTRNNQWAPHVALDGSGNATVAWIDFRNDQWDVFAARRPTSVRRSLQRRASTTARTSPYAWTDVRLRKAPAHARTSKGPLGSAGATANAWRPSLALVAGTKLVAVWQDFRALENRVYFAKSSDGGATWTVEGKPFVVWEDRRDGRRQLRYTIEP